MNESTETTTKAIAKRVPNRAEKRAAASQARKAVPVLPARKDKGKASKPTNGIKRPCKTSVV